MTTRRAALGSSWVSVHARGSAVAIAESVLELGFGGIQPGPAPNELPLDELEALRSTHPFALGPAYRLAPLMVVERRIDAGLGSRDSGFAGAAVDGIVATARRALELGIDKVILEPGRFPRSDYDGELDTLAPGVAASVRAGFDARCPNALDTVCRNLHRVCRAAPETTFCLTASRSLDGLGRIEVLEAIFDDLSRYKLGYWHEAALAAGLEERIGTPQAEWFDRLGDHLIGATVSDWADGRLHLPLGSGRVDLPGLFDALGSRTVERPLVVELDSEFGPAEAKHCAAVVKSMRRRQPS